MSNGFQRDLVELNQSQFQQKYGYDNSFLKREFHGLVANSGDFASNIIEASRYEGPTGFYYDYGSRLVLTGFHVRATGAGTLTRMTITRPPALDPDNAYTAADLQFSLSPNDSGIDQLSLSNFSTNMTEFRLDFLVGAATIDFILLGYYLPAGDTKL